MIGCFKLVMINLYCELHSKDRSSLKGNEVVIEDNVVKIGKASIYMCLSLNRLRTSL